MNWLKSKFQSATAIARERGAVGVAHAIGRNLGVPSLQGGLDESAIAWEYLRGDPAGTMVDVGAHYGTALRPFLRHGWTVWAFEPDPQNRARLLSAFAGSSALHVDPRAVAEHEQAGVMFYRSEVSSGISGLSAFDPSHRPGAPVDITTLSRLVDEQALTSIDFLKIDTEGHDLFVLRGLPWQRVRPRLILCEFEDRKTQPLGYRYEDLVSYLADQGYAVVTSEWYPITQYGIEHRWRAFSSGTPPRLVDPLGWGNVLALRDAQDMPRLMASCERAARRERARAH